MSADAVAAAARAGDPDRYVAALYAPQDKRPHLLALAAFQAEIDAIRGRVREAMAGELRLQWWRDTIAAGAPSGHPVADALNAAIGAAGLPRQAFDACLEARIFDLYDDPMPGRNDLEGYLGETEAALIQFAAMVLDPSSARDVAGLSGHAGCAIGIARILRLLPLHRARGQCYVPRDILAAAGTTPEAFLAEPEAAASCNAAEAMQALGVEHLRKFEGGAGAIPAAIRPAFLPVAVADLALSGHARHNDPSAWRRQLAILRRAVFGWPKR